VDRHRPERLKSLKVFDGHGARPVEPGSHPRVSIKLETDAGGKIMVRAPEEIATDFVCGETSSG
jgi:hypothetical protein